MELFAYSRLGSLKLSQELINAGVRVLLGDVVGLFEGFDF